MGYNWNDNWSGMMFSCSQNQGQMDVPILTFTSVKDNNYIGGAYHNIPIFDKIYGSGKLQYPRCIGCMPYGGNVWYVYGLADTAAARAITGLDNIVDKESSGTAATTYTYSWEEMRAQFLEMSKYENDYSCSIEIPDSITYIDDEFFYQCKINKLTLGKDVTYIGSRAFTRYDLTEEATKLTNTFDTLILPATLEYIGDDAFRNNAYLKYIDFKNLKFDSSIDGSFFIDINFRNIGEDNDWYEDRKITYLRGNNYVLSHDWFNLEYRKINYWEPDIYGYYHCYDAVNGDQKFPLYAKKEGLYNKAYFINSIQRTGYLKLVEMEDTSGGNRVQYDSSLNKSLRFKK